MRVQRAIKADPSNSGTAAWDGLSGRRLDADAAMELGSALRVIGAEMEMARHEAVAGSSTLEEGSGVERLRVLVTWAIVLAEKQELDCRGGSAALPGQFSLSGCFREMLGGISALADRLGREGGGANSNPAWHEVGRCYERAWQCLASPRSNGCLPDGVQLLEFHSEITGYPRHLLGELENLERALVINPREERPQEGFGRSVARAEFEDILACRDARLLSILRQGELVGFYALHTDQLSLLPEVAEIFDLLEKRGLLPPDGRAGWAEIVGVKRQARLPLARQGIQAYELMDAAVMETARLERLEALFSYVREGGQANLSKAAHLRVGWLETGLMIELGAPPIPYQILMRPVPKLSAAELREPKALEVPGPETPGLSWAPKHLRPLADFADLTPFTPYAKIAGDDQRALKAPYLSDAEAVARCREQFGGSVKVQPLYCSDALVIMCLSGTLHLNLRQLRPRSDYWRYRPIAGPDVQGPLAEVFAAVWEDLRRQ